MSIIVGADSRILIQGITGSIGRQFAERMRVSGTPLVGGVAPGRGGQQVAGAPVFDTVAEAVQHTGATCSLVIVPPPMVVSACEDAIAAGITTLVNYTENVAAHDSVRIVNLARSRGVLLFGPNSAGVVSPGAANLSDLADENVPAGRIGVVSKSGTLTYEVLDLLRRAGLGASTVVCLGGDPMVGTEHADVVGLFLQDDGTDAIVMVGEIGGQAEPRAAQAWQRAGAGKPLIAYVAGHAAPPGQRMGHAGAIVSGAGDSAAAKSAVLAAHGVSVAKTVMEIPQLVLRALG